VKRTRPSSEESDVTGVALRRRQLREKLRAGRTETSETKAKKKAILPAIEERLTQLRDDVRAAEQKAVAALVETLESRIHQSKLERRQLERKAVQQEKASEGTQQQVPEQDVEVQEEPLIALPVAGVEEEPRRAKRQESKQNAQLENESQLATLQRKEQRRQTAAMKVAEEAKATERRSKAKEQKQAVATPEEAPEPPGFEEPASVARVVQRDEDESRVAATRQLRREAQQAHAAHREKVEQAATERHQKRKELKKQVAEAARAEAMAAEPLAAAAQPLISEQADSDTADSPSPAVIEPGVLTRLATIGNFILDDYQNAVALRGVNVTGLDTAAPAEGQTLPESIGLDEDNLAVITGSWKFNLIRLPFLAQTVLAGNGSLSAANILDGLDQAIALAANSGAYVLLSLQAAAGAILPDAASQQAWDLLAARYTNQPTVLYEIFASSQQLDASWLQNGLSLIGTIRQHNTGAMIFVNTGTNGSNFTGLPLTFPTGAPIFNLVYTVNVSAESTPGLNEDLVASFADVYPVFASTWSDNADNPSRVSPYLGDFFGRHNIGWAAASWNADPKLVSDAVNHDFSATGWGLIAGRAATLPVQPYLKPF